MLDCARTALSRSKRLIDPVVGKERGLGGDGRGCQARSESMPFTGVKPLCEGGGGGGEGGGRRNKSGSLNCFRLGGWLDFTLAHYTTSRPTPLARCDDHDQNARRSFNNGFYFWSGTRATSAQLRVDIQSVF